MSHADALRDMADHYRGLRAHVKGRSAEVVEETTTALLAGAAALDALTKVQKVAELLDQMAEDIRRAATRLDWAAPGAIGREHAYTKAAQFIREATGDTK